MLDGVGVATSEGGADGLVGFLGAGVLAGVGGRGSGHELFAEACGYDLAALLLGYGGYVGGVGSHVGDEAGGAFDTHVDAFVKLLGDQHGLAGSEVELAGGFLLEGGGGEGREGCAGPRAF